MRVFKTVVAIVAVVAVLGSGAFATKAWADSSTATTSQVNHNHSLSTTYKELVQKQIEPLQ